MHQAAAQPIFPSRPSTWGTVARPQAAQRPASAPTTAREALIPAAARQRMGPRALRLLRADD